jgi:DNA-binding PadR family transcriptional regulator
MDKSRRKRRYVLTPRGREALLANLEQARRASPWIVYRPTPRRLAALHANLVKALEVRWARARQDAEPSDEAGQV